MLLISKFASFSSLKTEGSHILPLNLQWNQEIYKTIYNSKRIPQEQCSFNLTEMSSIELKLL